MLLISVIASGSVNNEGLVGFQAISILWFSFVSSRVLKGRSILA